MECLATVGCGGSGSRRQMDLGEERRAEPLASSNVAGPWSGMWRVRGVSPLETAWWLQACEAAGHLGLSPVFKPCHGFRAEEEAASLAAHAQQCACVTGSRGPGKVDVAPEKQKATARVAFWNLVPVKRVELPTFALRMRCSTN